MQPSASASSPMQAYRTTPPRISEESIVSGSSKDLLEVWLRSVFRLADVGSAENFSSLKDLANTIPITEEKLPEMLPEVREVISSVQTVAKTHIFNPLLAERVQAALQALSRV